jgi:hypothetical protein
VRIQSWTAGWPGGRSAAIDLYQDAGSAHWPHRPPVPLPALWLASPAAGGRSIALLSAHAVAVVADQGITSTLGLQYAIVGIWRYLDGRYGSR